MRRITPVYWKKLECVFLQAGFQFARQVGSHKHYVKNGIIRPVVIPVHNKPVEPFIIKNNMRTAQMSREDYFKYLDQC